MFIEKYNLLFIHIPKTAGSAVMNAFDELVPGCVDNVRKIKHPKLFTPYHLTLEEYYDLNILPKDVLDNSIKFAVVRDPLKRAFSEYLYHHRRLWSWNKFLFFIPQEIFLDNYNKQDFLRHIIPQHKFVDSSVNIIHQENLQFEFDTFLNKNNIPKINLKKTNKNIPMCDIDLKRWKQESDFGYVRNVINYYIQDYLQFNYEIPKVSLYET